MLAICVQTVSSKRLSSPACVLLSTSEFVIAYLCWFYTCHFVPKCQKHRSSRGCTPLATGSRPLVASKDAPQTVCDDGVCACLSLRKNCVFVSSVLDRVCASVSEVEEINLPLLEGVQMLRCSQRDAVGRADGVHGGALKIARTPRFDNWTSFSLNAVEREE